MSALVRPLRERRSDFVGIRADDTRPRSGSASSSLAARDRDGTGKGSHRRHGQDVDALAAQVMAVAATAEPRRPR